MVSAFCALCTDRMNAELSLDYLLSSISSINLLFFSYINTTLCDYFSITVIFEISQCNTSDVVLGSFHIHINFKSTLVVSILKLAHVLIGILLDAQIISWKIDYLNSIEAFIQIICIAFHLLGYS